MQDNFYNIELSKSAIDQIRAVRTSLASLRIYVIGGGCSGFEYGFELSIAEDDDFKFMFEDVEIIVDPMSMQYLNGAKIDFESTLYGQRFRVKNPNAKTTCSCGNSFSVEQK